MNPKSNIPSFLTYVKHPRTFAQISDCVENNEMFIALMPVDYNRNLWITRPVLVFYSEPKIYRDDFMMGEWSESQRYHTLHAIELSNEPKDVFFLEELKYLHEHLSEIFFVMPEQMLQSFYEHNIGNGMEDPYDSGDTLLPFALNALKLRKKLIENTKDYNDEQNEIYLANQKEIEDDLKERREALIALYSR